MATGLSNVPWLQAPNQPKNFTESELCVLIDTASPYHIPYLYALFTVYIHLNFLLVDSFIVL